LVEIQISGGKIASAEVTFWKNVSGVYTADPRQVPEAFPIQSMSLGRDPVTPFRYQSMEKDVNQEETQK